MTGGDGANDSCHGGDGDADSADSSCETTIGVP
jgi:hypothetical protein